jgi:hypothetical protein
MSVSGKPTVMLLKPEVYYCWDWEIIDGYDIGRGMGFHALKVGLH